MPSQARASQTGPRDSLASGSSSPVRLPLQQCHVEAPPHCIQQICWQAGKDLHFGAAWTPARCKSQPTPGLPARFARHAGSRPLLQGLRQQPACAPALLLLLGLLGLLGLLEDLAIRGGGKGGGSPPHHAVLRAQLPPGLRPPWTHKPPPMPCRGGGGRARGAAACGTSGSCAPCRPLRSPLQTLQDGGQEPAVQYLQLRRARHAG